MEIDTLLDAYLSKIAKFINEINSRNFPCAGKETSF